MQVKGKSEQVSVFEVFDNDSLFIRDAKHKNRSNFEQGVLCYHLQEYEQALIFFKICLEENPFDQVAQFYVNKLVNS
ncbi:hypothetical protein PN462_16075 [Spirulina sp. CS-785/01]|uniref:hypothetical protein n=1 Tax=Spirulina sp. CS-785/01 TaxID=3021716 RepID=UPI00232EDAEF|nr:hypothetical protein [Spirulina sp. CS-785/01]MDB9314630.1 hypothetical protein [Spirulina sp. CS-785/01]